MKTTYEKWTKQMKRAGLVFGLAVAMAVSVGTAQAAEGEPEAKAEAAAPDAINHYGEKNSWELGGSVAFSVLRDSIGLQVTPNFGYFVADRIELSALVSGQYEWTREDDGTSSNSASGVIEFEPSYHYPLTQDLLVFGGLGVGPGYDGNSFEFDVVPRAGINLKLGKSVVFTPAVRLPITFNDEGVAGGLLVEAGVGATF